MSGEHDKGIDPHHDEVLTGPAHVVVLSALERDQARTWHCCHKTEEGMTRDVLRVHPADPHHTLQACAFGPVISEGYSLGNTQDSLLLDLKEKGQGIRLQLVHLLLQQQITRGFACHRTAPGAPIAPRLLHGLWSPAHFPTPTGASSSLENSRLKNTTPTLTRGSWI